MMMKTVRTIFIGDVHGCYKELKKLIKKLQLTKNDQVYLTGDLILKGKKSIKVLKYAKKNGFLWVKGNKEHEILASIKSGKYFSAEEEKLGRKLLHKHPNLIEYIEAQPYYIDNENFLLVHGGVAPGITIKKQKPKDLCYIRDYNKKPWYEYYTESKKIIYGHWALDGLKIRENTIGLDTGCVYGGELSAYILETGEIIQQPALKLHKNPFKKGDLKYYLKELVFSISHWKKGK